MKNKKWIILGGILVIVVAIIILLVVSYQPVSKKSDEVTFVIKPGTNKVEIVSSLKKAGLIRSNLATLIYVFFTSDNLQAGTYIIDRSDSTFEIIKQIELGQTKEVPATIRITFVEGKRFVDYANLISNNFDITYDEIIAKGEDKTFLKELIAEYWFLDESILDEDIYYPLEGYLAPNTYEFYQTADIETIIRKLLDQTDINLTKLKGNIEKSDYTVHELLTMSSIIEKEAVKKDDREKVSQVIYKRLDTNMNLGMDVTTYYAAFKDMKETLTAADLDAYNAYNTRNRNFIGLPVGSICNPSVESIVASLNPSKTNYVYFIADVDTGDVYFMETYEEFIRYKNELGLGE